MSIKTTGGIFGRNPTFRNVEIEGNLTVDGTLQNNGSDVLVDSDIGVSVQGYDADTTKNDVSNTFTQDQVFNADVGIGVSPTYPLQILSSTTTDVSVAKFGASNYGTSGKTYVEIGTQYGDGGSRLGSVNISGNKSALVFEPMTSTSGVYSEVLRVDSGEVTITGVSLKFATAGAGIDFSATAGTGTSELFDDYEEGTWTATVKGSTTDPSSALTATGYYTKIGDTVTAWVRIENGTSTGASGNASISGLPYTSNASVYAVNDVFCNQLNTASLLVQVDPSTTVIRLLQENGNAATWSSPGAGMYATVQVTYKV